MATLGTAAPARRGRRSRRPPTTPLADRRRRWFWPFVAPALIIYAAIIIGPSLAAIYISFNRWRGSGPLAWSGLQNYQILWQDPSFRQAFSNTLWVLLGVGGVVFLISFGVTMLLREMRGRQFVRAVLFFPFMVSPLVLSVIWGFLFDHNGMINTTIHRVGLGNGIEWLSSANLFKVVLVGLVWINVGLYTTIILAAADRIPSHIYEDCALAGTSPLQRLIHVTLPMSRDVVGVAAVLWTINTLKMFEFIYAFGGTSTGLPPTSVWNSPLFVYGESFGGEVPSYRFGYACASALVSLALFGVFAILLRRWFQRTAVQF